MRVAFFARSTLYSVPGGDTVQVLGTAKYLRRAGIEVDVLLTNKPIPDKPIDYSVYDLLHFFNIIRPADILKHITCGKPYVVSTIFADYAEFEKKQRKGLPGMLFRLFTPGFIEYSKTIARALTGKDVIASPQYLWLGHSGAVKKVLRHAACLLPNSESEYKRLRQAYGIEKKYMIVPNGIDTEIFSPPPPGNVKDENMVVCAARIEGIKNQLNLIRALSNTRFRLYLIGNAAPHHINYYRRCKEIAANNVIFINNLPQAALRDYYSKAKVHVLPSWFETTGLSSLEAAAMGCNIVAGNRGDATAYFGEHAFYCDPASPGSIYEAVVKAAASPADPALGDHIRRKFTWEQAASTTIQAYQAIVCE
jgi:glycosyltransferase involved in cell wall biosynthesis